MGEARERLARWIAGRDGIAWAAKESGEAGVDPVTAELPTRHDEPRPKLREVDHRGRRAGEPK